MTSPKGRLSPIGIVPRATKFRVAGTVHTGLFEFDSQWAYVPLSTAQRLFGEEGRASLVEVRLADIYAVRRAAEAILDKLGHGYLTSDWIQLNQSLFSALWLEKMAIAVTIALIVMVAALNIIATLILMVMEKHKDIAILVSMGASRAGVMRIFMLQGTLIGAAGTLAGGPVHGWAAFAGLASHLLRDASDDAAPTPLLWPWRPPRQIGRRWAAAGVAALALGSLLVSRRAAGVEPRTSTADAAGGTARPRTA
jgi:ABC-type lipoprotein release transport system permease subunit